MEEQIGAQPIAEARVLIDWRTFRAHIRFFAWRNPLYWLMRLLLAAAMVAAVYLIVTDIRFYLIDTGPAIYTVAVFCVGTAYFQGTGTYRAFRANRAFYETPGTVAFYEAYMTSLCVTDTKRSTQKILYACVKDIYETRTAFYIQVKEAPGYILAKKFFSPAQRQALRELFARQLGKRFRITLRRSL